jgi:hypothetical protein
MKSYYALEPAEIAEMYVRAKGGPRQLPRTARSLYDDIQAYLTGHGMQHRLNEAAEIAEHAYLIAQQVLAQEVPASSEAQAAFRANVEGGTTASDAELAEYVSGLNMNQYAAERERLGVTQGGLSSFLGGSTR